MKYELNKSDTYKGRADKVKIEYLRGLLSGKIVKMRRIIAEDLIHRGYAKEIE